MARDIEPNLILDPAERIVDPDYVARLVARYRDHQPVPGGISLTDDQYDHVYGNLCDVACQLLWAEKLNITPEDDLSHTSTAAREIANILMAAAGFANPMD